MCQVSGDSFGCTRSEPLTIKQHSVHFCHSQYSRGSSHSYRCHLLWISALIGPIIEINAFAERTPSEYQLQWRLYWGCWAYSQSLHQMKLSKLLVNVSMFFQLLSEKNLNSVFRTWNRCCWFHVGIGSKRGLLWRPIHKERVRRNVTSTWHSTNNGNHCCQLVVFTHSAAGAALRK